MIVGVAVVVCLCAAIFILRRRRKSEAALTEKAEMDTSILRDPSDHVPPPKAELQADPKVLEIGNRQDAVELPSNQKSVELDAAPKYPSSRTPLYEAEMQARERSMRTAQEDSVDSTGSPTLAW